MLIHNSKHEIDKWLRDNGAIPDDEYDDINSSNWGGYYEIGNFYVRVLMQAGQIQFGNKDGWDKWGNSVNFTLDHLPHDFYELEQALVYAILNGYTSQVLWFRERYDLGPIIRQYKRAIYLERKIDKNFRYELPKTGLEKKKFNHKHRIKAARACKRQEG